MKEQLTGPYQFVRQASGLVKEFGTFDTFVFNVLGYSLGLVLAVTPTFLGSLYPHANIYLVLTLGIALSLFNGMTYGLFAAAMPRSGGDYVYIGRTLSPMLGFVANWGFSWSQFLGIGVYTGWCVSTALSPALTTVGYAIGFESFVETGSKVAEPSMIWAIGSFLLVTVLLISVRGMRVLKYFLNFLFLAALAGTFGMLYIFVSTSNQEFIAVFNDFMLKHSNLPDAYNYIITLARENGLQARGETSFWSSLLALPIGYWVFIGFTYSVYIGGEIKEPQRTQSVAIIGSLAFGYLVYMVTMGRYYDVVGKEFNDAVAIVQNLHNSPLVAGGSMGFFAGILTKSAPLNLLMGVSTFLWFYLLLVVMTTFCVRNIFAWSFDKIIPQSFSKVSVRTRSPWIALLTIIGLAELFLSLHAFVGIAFINYIAMFSVCFLMAGIAAIVFPLRRSQLFLAAPPIVRKKVLGMPLISIAGIGNVALFLLVLYSALTNPGVSGVQGWIPSLILLLVYGIGVAVYYVAKHTRKSQGVDLNLLYGEIPPE